MEKKERGEGLRTYRVASRGTEEHGVRGIHLVAPDAFPLHLALHELLVRPEVDAVSGRLAPERHDLALVDPGDAVLARDLLHRVERACVDRVCGGLRLEPCMGARRGQRRAPRRAREVTKGDGDVGKRIGYLIVLHDWRTPYGTVLSRMEASD